MLSVIVSETFSLFFILFFFLSFSFFVSGESLLFFFRLLLFSLVSLLFSFSLLLFIAFYFSLFCLSFCLEPTSPLDLNYFGLFFLRIATKQIANF